MFNGIIKNIGKISKIDRIGKNCSIEIYSKMKFEKDDIGSSVACSGTCLTLEKYKKNFIYFYLSKETLNRTIFKNLKKGDIVNLEKPLKYGDKISGHFVQGHVDTTAKVVKIHHVGKSWLISFKIPNSYLKYLVQKGSVTVNGVSLTIANIIGGGFKISVIPKTLKLTNLINLKEKDLVNIEIDILGKYVKKFINKKL